MNNSKERFPRICSAAHWELVQLCFQQIPNTFPFTALPLKATSRPLPAEIGVQGCQGSPSPAASLSPEVWDREGTMTLGWASAREPGAGAGVDTGRWLFGDIRGLQLATELADSQSPLSAAHPHCPAQ